MKIIPRLVFWLGVISIVYGIILRIATHYGSAIRWPFGLTPGNFMEFSLVCFVSAIAFSVVYIFGKKKD